MGKYQRKNYRPISLAEMEQMANKGITYRTIQQWAELKNVTIAAIWQEIRCHPAKFTTLRKYMGTVVVGRILNLRPEGIEPLNLKAIIS